MYRRSTRVVYAVVVIILAIIALLVWIYFFGRSPQSATAEQTARTIIGVEPQARWELLDVNFSSACYDGDDTYTIWLIADDALRVFQDDDRDGVADEMSVFAELPDEKYEVLTRVSSAATKNGEATLTDDTGSVVLSLQDTDADGVADNINWSTPPPAE